MKLSAITLGLVMGNYIYQWLQLSPDYLVAFSKSYSQMVAIAVVWFFFIRKGARK